MGGSESEASEETETAVSHSCADTNTLDSPAMQRRKTFSHYTQVRHNGYLTKRFKLAGPAASPWSRQFCTVHGNILRCFSGKRQFTDHEDPVETNIIRAVRPWEAEFSKPYNRGLLIDCEGGETIIARTDTSAEQEEWAEALGTVTDLLGNGAGGGGASGGAGYDSDEDDEGGDGLGGMQTTYLAQKDELLSPAEATGACIVVFQVAKTTLTRIDDVDVGRFNNGDVYLVMHAVHDISGDSGVRGSGAGITRTLFYWVGSKASMDKGTVACIKAVELRRALPGPCCIRREDEGQESPEFLVMFDELTVAEDESGARVLSKVKKWNEQPPIMYSVRMRTMANEGDGNPKTVERYRRPPLHSSFTVGRIDLDEDQLGSERVLLVDDRNGHVYLWFGTMSTFKHRGFGLEAATRLKADSPKGGQVVQVDEDDEPPELRRILDRARKQRLLELQVRAAEGDDNDAEEEGAEQRRMSLMGASAEGAGPAVSLFRVTQAEGGLQLSLVACTSREYIAMIGGDELEPEQDGAPMLSMLEGDAAFILDVFTEVFVWIGDDADRTARIGAGKVAQQLVHAVARPPWAEEITHVRDDREPFLFRVKFFDWGVARQRRGGGTTGPTNCMVSFHKAIRTIAEVRHDPEEELELKSTAVLLKGMEVDLPHPADAEVAAAGAGEDDGFGELLMWRVHQRGLVSVPEEEFGHVQSSHSYVFLYGHDASGGQDQDDEDEEAESGEDSSSDNDSLLSDLDGREGMSDNDDAGDAVGIGTTPTAKKKPAAGGVDSSKRKTMFAEMKRESIAGSLQPTAKKGARRQRRDSCGDSDDEDLEKMQVPIEEEEEEEGSDDNEEQVYEGGRNERGKSGSSKPKKAKNKTGSSRRPGRGGNADTSDQASSDEDDVSDLSSSVASDDDDDDDDSSADGAGGERGRGSKGEEEDGEEAQPRFLIYFWAGSRAKKSDWVLWKLELAKSMLPEWQKVINAEIPQVQVAQGQEPLHFRRLFGQGRDHGRLIVHDRVWRKRDNPEKRVSLFKVQRVPDGEFQTFQVPPNVRSLNSMDVFVCICTVVTDDWVGNNDEAVFFWVGRHAPLSLQEHGAKVLMALMEYYCMPADFNVSILEEDELYDDHAQLWDELSEMLGGEVAWANWNGVFDEEFDADEDLGCAPKLYVADCATGNVVLTYVGHIQRTCLVSETVAVLDTVEGVYVWRGRLSDTAHYDVICRACEEYCLNKPLPVGRKVVKVREGHEPLVFRARFQAWDDGGPGETKKFQDVYEQRVDQMSKEGTLGDMSALRGRVLGDEEAAKYWDQRGAEPGGQGVRGGVFRDDPASRSTQRRGAPGRKAWVKPPPKPVVVDRTKELDAKRNFLAIKDRFEGHGEGSGEAFKKPTNRTFSRRNMLQEREASIALGHSMRVKDTFEKNSSKQQGGNGNALATTAAGRLNSTNRRSSGQAGQRGDDDGPLVTPEGGEVDAHVFLSKHSWGSASSARRRHNAVMEAQAEAAAEQARRSLEAAAAPQNSSSRRESRIRASVDSTGVVARRRESFDSTSGSTGGGGGGSGKGSLDSAAGSASGGEGSMGSPPPPPPPRPPGGVAVGGWVRQETFVGADGSSSSLSPPLPPPRGASPAERGGRVVSRWVRRSGIGSRDSSLSVSPVLPPRKPPVAAGGARGSPGGIKQPRDRASPDSTAAAVEQGGGRGSTGSAAGLAVAAEEQERVQAEASFAMDTGLASPKEEVVGVSTTQIKDQVLQARWEQESGSTVGTDRERDSFEAGVFAPRVAAADLQSNAAAAAEKESSWRRSRSRSESVVDNEGLQEALEKAEQEERRRSSLTLGNSNARSSGAGAGASAKARLGKSGRGNSGGSSGRASGGGGVGTVAHSDEKAAEAYSLALAQVRHETVQEGLRKKGYKDLSAATSPEDGKLGKTTVVSIKHTMSRVKAGAGDGTAPSAPGATTSGEARVADGSRLKAALRASIESRTSSHEGTGELDDDDQDLDSPRNRGRQYDDRWKMPGHAESVLASFVERLEHRGHAIEDNSGGGAGVASGEVSAAAALEEARANRGAAVAVLGRSHRLQSERKARNSPGPSAVLAESGKKRRSAGGGGKGGSRAKNGAGTRSRGKGGNSSASGRRGSVGKGRTATATAAGINESGGHKRSSPGGGGGGGGISANTGAWSKIASSFQRAAEAIVGVSKEDGEEEQQHRTEVDRTRTAVTAFLSSSRTQDQE
eukprot:g8942.t1